MNLRYIVYVGGHAEIRSLASTWIEGNSVGFPVIMGLSAWDRNTAVNALILDLQAPQQTTDLELLAEGTAWVAGLFPFVVGAPSTSGRRACREIGEYVASALAVATATATDN